MTGKETEEGQSQLETTTERAVEIRASAGESKAKTMMDLFNC